MNTTTKPESHWYERFRSDVFWIVVITFAINVVRSCAHLDTDSTDSPTARSNLELHTDYGTGCQYLSARNGGLTPRLDASGQQVCAAGEEG